MFQQPGAHRDRVRAGAAPGLHGAGVAHRRIHHHDGARVGPAKLHPRGQNRLQVGQLIQRHVHVKGPLRDTIGLVFRLAGGQRPRAAAHGQAGQGVFQPEPVFVQAVAGNRRGAQLQGGLHPAGVHPDAPVQYDEGQGILALGDQQKLDQGLLSGLCGGKAVVHQFQNGLVKAHVLVGQPVKGAGGHSQPNGAAGIFRYFIGCHRCSPFQIRECRGILRATAVRFFGLAAAGIVATGDTCAMARCMAACRGCR